jgi:HK97 family phage prohead protease
MKTNRKIVLLKDASVSSSGRLEGYAAIYGNVDDGGDIIEAGALQPAIPGFLQAGFISWGHDWGVPVAMPKSATSDASGLAITADFHSTPTAQEKRTITKERLDAGLTMGLSIGYGDITAKRGPEARSISEIRKLFEVGLVMVPMNAEAGVSDVKGMKAAADNVSRAVYCLTTINELIEGEAMDAEGGDAQDAADVDALIGARDWLLEFIGNESAEVGTTGDLEDVRAEDAARAAMYADWGWMGRSRAPFATHIESIETGLKALITRSRAVSRLRKEGRVLSSANRTRLEELATALAAGESDIRDLLASTDPDTGKAARAAEIEYLLAQAAELELAIA